MLTWRDLRIQSRKPSSWVLRALWAAAAAAFALVTLWPWLLVPSLLRRQGHAGGGLAALAFAGATLAQALVALLLAGQGAGSMADERRARTLPLLHLTRLRSWEILAGKLGADVASLLALLVAVLPVGALLSWIGGVDPRLALEASCLILALGAAGMTAGALLGCLYASRLAIALVSLGALAAAALSLVPGARAALGAAHPVLALWEVAWQIPATDRQTSTAPAVVLLVGSAAAIFAVSGLLLAGLDRVPGRGRPLAARSAGRGGPRRLRGNPVRHLATSGGWLPARGAGYVAAAASAASLGAIWWMSPLSRPAAWAASAALALVLLVLPASWTTGLFTQDRLRILRATLGATPLGAGRMLGGYLQAAALRYLPVAGALLLPLLVLLVGQGIEWRWIAWIGIHSLVHALLGLCIGLLFSIWLRHRLRALVGGIVTTALAAGSCLATGLALAPLLFVLLQALSRGSSAALNVHVSIPSIAALASVSIASLLHLPVARAFFYGGLRNLDRSLGRST